MINQLIQGLIGLVLMLLVAWCLSGCAWSDLEDLANEQKSCEAFQKAVNDVHPPTEWPSSVTRKIEDCKKLGAWNE